MRGAKWLHKACNIPICQFLLWRLPRPIISAMKLDSKYFDGIRTRLQGDPETRADGTQMSVGRVRGECCSSRRWVAMPKMNFSCSASSTSRNTTRVTTIFRDFPTARSRYQKEAITGHRPTWTVGVNKNAKNAPQQSQQRSGSAGAQARMRDPFGFVDQARARVPRQEPRLRKLKTLEAKAFETLGLHANATPADVKTAYKELVKSITPMQMAETGGSEERFRAVIQAYQLLKQAGFC
ncbi:J domain-containing protein [Rhizobium sp. RCAM05350]|nr:J domain-containing protein [Rhizobium sp. RCAM05350]